MGEAAGGAAAGQGRTQADDAATGQVVVAAGQQGQDAAEAVPDDVDRAGAQSTDTLAQPLDRLFRRRGHAHVLELVDVETFLA